MSCDEAKAAQIGHLKCSSNTQGCCVQSKAVFDRRSSKRQTEHEDVFCSAYDFLVDLKVWLLHHRRPDLNSAVQQFSNCSNNVF